MRDLALLLTLAALLPLAFRFPFVGVYVWTWLALMNPHRLAFGFVHDMPLNLIVASVTILGWIFTAERKRFEVTAFSILAILFAIWFSLTTLAAPVPEITVPLWERSIKAMLLVVAIMAVINTRVRLIGLLWIIAVSIGFFGVKGGIFMAGTGGKYIVFGPESSMIEDNNCLALALIMVAPILNYLRVHAHHRLLRLGLAFAMVMVAISVIGSYSRGGLIALGAMLAFLCLRSRSKLATMALALVVAVAVISFMPTKYKERISTISDAEQDASFQGRLDAWGVAWRTALDHPMGAGFDGPRQDIIWNRYLPDRPARASHSIYFMVLGEHGFIGLGLYLAMLMAAWWNLMRVNRLARKRPDLLWARDLAQALQVVMVGFMVGGAALPMAYYDGFLSLLACGAVLRAVVERELKPERARHKLQVIAPTPRASAGATS